MNYNALYVLCLSQNHQLFCSVFIQERVIFFATELNIWDLLSPHTQDKNERFVLVSGFHLRTVQTIDVGNRNIKTEIILEETFLLLSILTRSIHRS